MSPALDKPPEAPTLEQELEHLEQEENELDDRASSLELKTILIAMLAGLALVLSVAALAVALIRTGNSNSHPAAVMQGAAAGTGMGSGMMNGSAANSQATAPVVNGAHLISVRLGEMYARPSVTSVPAGKVTFRATNMGMLTHELMVERMPIKMESPGKPVESAAQGMIDDMQHGQSGQMTLKLTPGKYMLFCNVPGHYAAGQHTVLTVTRS
jgi:uncharacterized cupredoxin-like copper-binding protein